MKQFKKYLKLIVLIITCFLVYFIYHHNDHHNITYIALGDSFAMGMSSNGSRSYGYHDYLKDYLKKHDKLHKYYTNFSYQDMRITDLYKDILINEKDKENENLKQALRESNLLTLSVGINDLIYQQGLKGQIKEEEKKEIIEKIEKDFKKLIREIKKYYQYEIYVIGYKNCYPQDSVEKDLLERLNLKYQDLAEEIGIEYIEVEEVLNKNCGYFQNEEKYYPSESEYKNIYHQILKEITIE